MINSVECLGSVLKTSTYRTAKIIMVLILINDFTVYMHKSVACLRLKPNWLSLVIRKVPNSFDKRNLSNLEVAVTIAIGL